MGDPVLLTRLQDARNRLLRRASSSRSPPNTLTLDTANAASTSRSASRTPLSSSKSTQSNSSSRIQSPVSASRPSAKRIPSFPKLIRRLSKSSTVLTDPEDTTNATSTLSPSTPASATKTEEPSVVPPKVTLEAPSPEKSAPPEGSPLTLPPTERVQTPHIVSQPSSGSLSRPHLNRTISSQARGISPSSSAGPANLGNAARRGPSSDTLRTIKPAPKMSRRRIWVRRQGASPTLVKISEDDYVDEVRDMIIAKYANSLGRSFDAPDIQLRIVPREGSHADRVLGPEEEMCRTLDAYFPGGQTVEEALIIEMPTRKTPRPSPRPMAVATHYFEEQRPAEEGEEYFPIMPASSPGHAHSQSSHSSRHAQSAHAISVIATGQLPALSSPGGRRRNPPRPLMARQHTSSPTIISTAPAVNRSTTSRNGSGGSQAPQPPALPTPPVTSIANSTNPASASTTPPATTPRPARPRKRRPNGLSHLHDASSNDANRSANPYANVVDAGIPPINVLIVEDNIINLKVLEQLARLLKVRFSSVMNGRDAVAKWRTGGFHLVLMDIQLPIMNGIEATKEIRRLERANGIGVFSRSAGESTRTASPVDDDEEGGDAGEKAEDEKEKQRAKKDSDELDDVSVFKSPVIIVALTASSLQSDRHEALAAGCNDFLTKPVDKMWLERKVTEWGCMQALIDYNGWRQWKAVAAEAERAKAEKDKGLTAEEREKKAKREAKKRALMDRFGAGGGGGSPSTAAATASTNGASSSAGGSGA